MKKWFKEKILSSNKNTMLFIGITIFFILFIYQSVLLCCNTYFNSNSDDVVQYSPILLQYINNIKNGVFGWFNFTNNYGASVFADVYYVPIDIFTAITFLLTFVMNDILAFSIVNLIKILLGVVVFAYFLQRKKFKNWLVLLLSFMYFSFGGSWIFLTYPTYFSLFFYLPLCLVVVDLYCNNKKWLLPLYSFVLVLYNFYNAYTLFVFMVFVYIVVKIRDDYKGINKLIKDVFNFGLHIVLGVFMGLFILLPTVLYIINYSVRINGNVEYVFKFEVYVKMVYRLFVHESGVLTFVTTGDYVHQQFNYYIGSMGLFYLILMFFLKDRVSRIYKWSMLVIVVMMIIPAFSMIFSGVATAYTRWFSLLNIIFIYFVGHVINSVELDKLNFKIKMKSIISMIFLYVLCFVLHLFVIVNSKADSYARYQNNIQSLFLLILFCVFLMLFVLFAFVKRKELMYGILCLEMIVATIINFHVSFESKNRDVIYSLNETNQVLSRIDIKNDELSRVYVNSDILSLTNLNRFTNKFTNERSYHSFMAKSIYGYEALSGKEKMALYTDYLNRYNPNNSRLMDYKYIVLEKATSNFALDYLDVYYEDDQYIIYYNKYYSPFYVYDSYYIKEEVIDSNLLSFEKNLFDGVILDNDIEGLKKISYSNGNLVETYDIVKEANLTKLNEFVYEFDVSEYSKFGYEGVVKIKEKNSNQINSIKATINGEKKECKLLSDVYECDFNDSVDMIEISADGNFEGVYYTVVVENDDSESVLLLFDSSDKKYLNFYVENSSIILKKDNEERFCMRGLCKIEDFDYNHILYDVFNIISLDKVNKIYYYFDDLDNYLEKADNSNLATNKSLTYRGSSINVKYDRANESVNDNVIVLPVSYSDEWVCNNKNYELIEVNGGFLGVLVSKEINNIDITISFKPKGVKIGALGSLVGFGLYGLYLFISFRLSREEKIKGENI